MIMVVMMVIITMVPLKIMNTCVENNRIMMVTMMVTIVI